MEVLSLGLCLLGYFKTLPSFLRPLSFWTPQYPLCYTPNHAIEVPIGVPLPEGIQGGQNNGAPPGFPASGNGLWYTAPGQSDSWSTQWLPVGNGYIAATTPGGTFQETMHLNIESLWSGGPFQDPTYNGGNQLPSEQATMAQDMQTIRQTIFESLNGTIDNIEELMLPAGAYGSYSAAGYLLTTMNTTGPVSGYFRWLDLDSAVAHTVWTQGNATFYRDSFCSHPAQACVQYVNSTGVDPLPPLTYTFSVTAESGLPIPNVTCFDNDTLQATGQVSDPGMSYEILARVRTTGNSTVSCSYIAGNATLSVDNAHEAWITWVGDTDYSMYAGNTASNFSFRGTDPGPSLPHIKPIARGTLPANLQGKWAELSSNPWGADYHANINLQMNYWFAEMTNMDVVIPVFNYIENTWAPRGTETAEILYNISRGWVTHDEMNIFGHTGMKLLGNSAQWADYPESAVWMMIHVWDHFDYTNNITWFRSQGWPLLKGVAEFHLDKLIEDLHFNDGTLVVNPCNSPEQLPITLGCAHAQQVIWQLFNAIEKGFTASGDTNTSFLEEVQAKRAQMDKGIHIGWWGQLQEWKVDMDQQNDTHRHLSHLIGLYPGYAVASYDPTVQGSNTTSYSRSDVLAAAEVSLIHRGNGTGPDADSGWEKVWRAACWAQLKNATEFYFELSYAIERNFAGNLWSMYSWPPGDDGIFQIDANFGYPAALLNALVQAPDVADISLPLVVTILPALPDAWPSGSLTGVRLRGSMTLNLKWAGGRPTFVEIIVDQSVTSRQVQVVYANEVVASFTTAANLQQTIGF
ncbi:glycoside hydrolase family 95 protein [Sparassis crispa]|uniref:Glycoside hydrolase family 95 protein n=1 Tax=Sparassis crispa TaxID=139825 RepID=A0A401GPZ3_9APHY|nr:glycoside hydrolase family 95 protein [Sparassis crispa]GBE84301.1 glycoside hydrolase family 95 protein [Sparassis crispa]